MATVLSTSTETATIEIISDSPGNPTISTINDGEIKWWKILKGQLCPGNDVDNACDIVDIDACISLC